MKKIVIYTSKYGSTEKYALWIAEALGCDAKKLSDMRAEDLVGFDAIIYGGGLYAGSIIGFKKFLTKLGNAESKKLVLFMVGITSPERKDFYADVAAKNIPSQYKGRFEVYAFHGDQQFSRMSGLHKLMMRMPKSMAEKKPPEERTDDDKRFIESFGKDVLLADKAFILPLINYINAVEAKA